MNVANIECIYSWHRGVLRRMHACLPNEWLSSVPHFWEKQPKETIKLTYPHYPHNAGVQKIMVPGTSVKSSKEALRLSRLYPGIIYSTAGIHPHDSKSIIEDPESWYEYETIANQPECVAIGPCGLDYQRDFSEPDVQKSIFEKQLILAAKLDKPVLIHERSAQSDVLDILKKWVVHRGPSSRTVVDGDDWLWVIFRFPNITQIVIRGFMGTTEEASRYLDRGYYLGFTGYLCKVRFMNTPRIQLNS